MEERRKIGGDGEGSSSNERNSKREAKKNRTWTKPGKDGSRRRLKGYKVLKICKSVQELL